MVRSGSWVPVLVVVMVASGVAGCSGGAGAGASPSVDPYEVGASAMAAAASASASARASRDAALGPDLAARREAALATPPPERPEQISEDTTEGAATTAVYFIDLYQYAFVTGDTKDFEAISSPQCVYCQSALKSMKNLHADGGWGDPWSVTVESVKYYDPNPGYDYSRVDITLSWGETVSHSGDGQTTNTEPPEESKTFILAMGYTNSGWFVREVEIVK